MVFIRPRTQEVSDLLRKLTQHPFQTTDKTVTQTLSKYKGIRCVNQFEKNIRIKDGMVGLQPNVKIIPKKNGFEIKLF